jgi:hypothetical protein
LNPTAEAFKSFDHDPAQSFMSNLNLDNEDEPKRGASRANSVRFDESAIHYAHGSRSSDLLPMRTGSGMSSHPLTERSLSHRSDGRQSSSTRTNSLGLEGSRLLGSVINSPMTPGMPPGLLILGPVPCIIRCWLSQNFSNDSLLYAAICSGSYKSSVDSRLISRLDFENLVQKDSEGIPRIKLPVFLPEATVSQASSRSNSPAPGLPALTINFIVRNFDCNDKAIKIVLGSDVLRSHSADILFSQDRLSIFDDERNRLTIPLVRPEDDLAFKSLLTTSVSPAVAAKTLSLTNGDATRGKVEEKAPEPAEPGIIGRPARPPGLQTDLPSSVTSVTSTASPPAISDYPDDFSSEHTQAKSPGPDHSLDNGTRPEPATRQDSGGIWGNWRRDSSSKADSASQSSTASGYRTTTTRTRGMKVLRPSAKTPTTSTRSFSAAHPVTPGSSDTTLLARRSSEITGANNHNDIQQPTPTKVVPMSKPSSANPVGGASAFGWLANSGPQKRTTTTAE